VVYGDAYGEGCQSAGSNAEKGGASALLFCVVTG